MYRYGFGYPPTINQLYTLLNYNEPWTDAPYFALPANAINVIAGETITIYGDALINVPAPIPGSFTVTYTCAIGTQSGINLIVAPTIDNIGDHSCQIVFKNGSYTIGTYTINLQVHDKVPVGNVKILIIGDSTLDSDIEPIAVETESILVNNTFTYIGTTGSIRKCEAYPGTSWRRLATNGDAPTYPSVFFKAGVLDIPAYFTDNSLATPDLVTIPLGINDVFTFCQTDITDEQINTTLGYSQTLVDAFLAYDANLRILIALPTICTNSASIWSANYAALRNCFRRNGIKIIHLLQIPETVLYATNVNTFITTNFPSDSIVNPATGWSNSLYLYSDNIHPNQSGHRFIANMLINSGYLTQSNKLYQEVFQQPPVNSLDTVTMLTPYLRISDTSSMLSNLLRKSDTATMLSNRLKISDTATMLSNRLKISDTATQLSGYIRTIGITSANGVSGSSSGGQNPLLTVSLGAITPSSVSSSGAITGTALSGTIVTPSQLNITAIGTLSLLTVTNTITSGSVLTSGKIVTGDPTVSNYFAGNVVGITASFPGMVYDATFVTPKRVSTGIDNTSGSLFIFRDETGGATRASINMNTGNVIGGALIANYGTDNGVDKIQANGSVLAPLYRMEGKIQNTSTTIDATATIWNDATNGSTVTYTLPGTASLSGGLFMFLKTGTGNLTLSGTIIKSDGSSVGSMTLASTDGLNQFWFNGSTWYQVK